MMKIIARIRTDFPTKFGVPRQSGLVEGLTGRIVFEPEFRDPEALRGLDGFSYLWLIWEFSENIRGGWSPTVRPPRFGGNKRLGVFATRSPFRPNPIGLSSVKIETVDLNTPEGPAITVSGVDMMDGTPIYDIKPYTPYTDCHPDALGGFAGTRPENIEVVYLVPLPDEWDEARREGLTGALAMDPRPSYHNDPDRVYGMEYAGHDVRFKVGDGRVTVVEIVYKD